MTDTNSTHSLPEYRRRPMIAVCGAADEIPSLNTLAEAIGRYLAEAGAVLICGGRGGVMAAACRGARSLGGLTIGILPGAERDAANADVVVALATGMGNARNMIIVQNADAVIAVGGGYGTLSEIALARKIGRPVVGLQSWDLGIAGDGQPHILAVHSPAEAVAQALQLAQAT